MLRKFKKNFIILSVSAVAMILLLLAIGINITNLILTNKRLDETLNEIFVFEKMQNDSDSQELERQLPEYDSNTMARPQFPTAIDPEAQTTTRFFCVIYNESTKKYTVHKDFIHKISEKKCISYAKKVKSNLDTANYIGTYRYRKLTNQGKTYYIFLNSAMEIHTMKLLVLISVIVFALSMIIVTIFLFLLSGKAVQPFAENAERQKQFITDASHEMKTPLMSISTSAEILNMEYSDDEWIKNIMAQTSHLSELITDLVTLSRLDEMSPVPDQTVFCLSDVIWESVESYLFIAEAKKKKMEIDIEDSIKYFGDAAMMQKLCAVLMSNAVKYCDKGGTIHFSLQQKDSRIYLRTSNPCKDHHIKEPQRLFDRFYRPDESRSNETGGFGIGLSIARAIVESCGGDISANCPDKDHVEFKIVL